MSVILKADILFINENSRDVLTIFLDIFLTKYFRKRGVNER